MKKLLILFMAFGLFAASCNNDKGKGANDRNNTSKDKDDYNDRDDDRNKDRDDEDRDDEERDDRNKDRDEDYSSGSWSSSDKRQWMKLCATEQVVESLGESKAKNYCECILDKLQERYPSLKKADASGTEEEGRELGQELALDCIKELGYEQ